MHVAGADLNDIYVITQEERQLISRHDFRYDGKICLFTGGTQHVEAFILQSLEGIRRGPRFEGPAPQHSGTGSSDGLGYAFDLFRRFDGTRSGNDSQLFPAYADALTDRNDRILRMKSPAGPLIRYIDADDLVDTFIALELFHIEDTRIAYEA